MSIRKKSRGNHTGPGSNGRGSSFSSGSSGVYNRDGTSRSAYQDVLPGTGPLGRGFGSDDTLPVPGVDGLHPQIDSGGFAQALQQLGLGSDFYDALYPLWKQYSGSGDAEVKTKLMEAIIQQIFQQDQRLYDQKVNADQREYDWNLKQDERQYTNATNTLARYMGAGISRDAAIQMMSGSAGNIGGGSGPSSMMGSAPNVTGMPTVGTQSSQIASQVINTLQGLVNTGMSAAQAYYQAKMQSNASYMSDQQKAGYDSANQVAGMFQDCIYSGNFTSDEISSLSNFDDWDKFLTAKSADNEYAAAIIDSPAYQKARGSYWGRKYTNDLWHSIRDSRNYGDMLDQQMRIAKSAAALNEVKTEQVGVEMAKINKEIQYFDTMQLEALSRIAQGDAQIALLDKQGKWIEKQTERYDDVVDSQINLNNANASLSRSEAKLNNQSFEYNDAGFPMLKQQRIEEISHELAKWQAINDPLNRQEEMKAWLLNGSNAYEAAYLDYMYKNAAGTFAADNPNLWKTIVAFKFSGAGDLVRAGGDAAGTAGAVLKALKYIPK